MPSHPVRSFLFVGDGDAATRIAGLYTIIATWQARGINPFADPIEVLAWVQGHPASRTEELRAGAWARAG